VKKTPIKLSALHFNGRERRSSARVRYDLDTVIESCDELKEIRLIDISQTGLSFISRGWQLEVGQCLDLKLSLPGCENQLSITVKICSKLGQKSGVQFIKIDAENLSHLKQALLEHDGSAGVPGFFSG
jgi:hypothetical protein